MKLIGTVVIITIVIFGTTYFMTTQLTKASTNDSDIPTTTQNITSNLNNNKNTQTQNFSNKINSNQINNLNNNNNNNNKTNTSQIQNKNNVSISNNNECKNNSTNTISNTNFNIEWVLGKNESSVPSTLVVKNISGEKISNQQLIAYIKKWILSAQLNYSQGCVATMWAPEFFNAVPDNDLVQAFINVNGEAALSKNITANEFGNTNSEIAKLISENQPLLTQSQIFDYIYKHILPKDDVVKIVNKKYSYVTYGMSNGKEVAYDSLSKYTGITACC